MCEVTNARTLGTRKATKTIVQGGVGSARVRGDFPSQTFNRTGTNVPYSTSRPNVHLFSCASCVRELQTKIVYALL